MRQARNSTGRFQSQLSDEQVELVRELVASGKSHGAVARRLGCNRSLVTRIVNGQRRRPTATPSSPSPGKSYEGPSDRGETAMENPPIS